MTVQEKMNATERRWREEVAKTEADLDRAENDFAEAGRRYDDALDDGEDSLPSYQACMSALARVDAARRRLDRLRDPRELADRLRNSRRLAERFS